MTKKQFFQALATLLIVPGGLLAGMAVIALAVLLAVGFTLFVSAGFALAVIADAAQWAERFWRSFRGSAPKNGMDDDHSRPASSRGAAFPEEQFNHRVVRTRERWLQ